MTFDRVLGEIFDYVDGVCDPRHPFATGNYGSSGEDVTHRLVLAGTFHIPGSFELSLLSQAESPRPFTLTTPVDVNGAGDSLNDRAVINGVQTSWINSAARPISRPISESAVPLTFMIAGA